MSARTAQALLALALCSAAIPASAMDKEAKLWLEGVRPLILSEEEKVYKDLKDKGDVAEFQKIFWARRDPDLDTPENESQAEYLKLKAEVDVQYRSGNKAGSLTDCGRVHVLLGAPDAVEKKDGVKWTYKSRPGLTFTEGQVVLPFGDDCMMSEAFEAQVRPQLLDRVAENRIVNPNLDYRRDDKKHIVKLSDQLPKPSPMMTLLNAPRQDFESQADLSMSIRLPEGGGTYSAGLVRASLGDPALTKLVLGVLALNEAGKKAASSEREITPRMEEGAAVGSFYVSLKPGTYNLRVGVLDPKTKKGSVSTVPVTVPDLNTGELAVSPLLVVPEIQDNVTGATASDAYAAFTFGPTRFLPRPKNAFTKADAATLICWIYNAKLDEAGKASALATFEILRDEKGTLKPVAKGDQAIDTAQTAPAVGPIPFAADKYTPGPYVARVKVIDRIAKKEEIRETRFEIK